MAHVVAVTGHRPNKLLGYGNDATNALNKFAISVLEPHVANIKHVRTGMAQGWDQAVAFACAALNIPFYAYIPFAGQESKWPQAAKEYFNLLLSRATGVIVVSEGGYAAYKMHVRNKALIDGIGSDVGTANFLLSLYNGTGGGTAHCIEYGKEKDVKIINAWDEFKEFIHGN